MSTTPKAKAKKPVSNSRKAEGMRETIIRAATEQINSKSYALATLTGIAATLDMRDAALYHYFPSKQALAYACHRSSLARVEKLLVATDGAGGSGEEKLRHFIRAMLDEAAANGPQLYFGDYSYLESAQRKAIAAWGNKLRDYLIKFLKEGMADGSIVQCEPELVGAVADGHADLARQVGAVRRRAHRRSPDERDRRDRLPRPGPRPVPHACERRRQARRREIEKG